MGIVHNLCGAQTLTPRSLCLFFALRYSHTEEQITAKFQTQQPSRQGSYPSAKACKEKSGEAKTFTHKMCIPRPFQQYQKCQVEQVSRILVYFTTNEQQYKKPE